MSSNFFQRAYYQAVNRNLSFLLENNYEKIEMDEKKRPVYFFYKQINSQIGSLVYYPNSKCKDYSLHSFDLYICNSTNYQEAIYAYKKGTDMADFWIPSMYVDRPSNMDCLLSLNNENEKDIDKLSKKYEMLYSTRVIKDRLQYEICNLPVIS